MNRTKAPLIPGSRTAPRNGSPAGKTIPMMLGEIVELYNVGIGNMDAGFPGLNGYHKAVGEGIMLQPYSLTDETRQKITHNKFILRPYVTEMDKEERARITRLVTGDEKAIHMPSPKDDPAANARWHLLYHEAMKVEHAVPGLHVFKRDDLFRENRNPIPNATEIALYPIIENSPWWLARVPAAEAPPPGGE